MTIKPNKRDGLSYTHEPREASQSFAKNHILVCEGDHSIRWQAGERLHHLFEQRVDQYEAGSEAQHLAVDSVEGQWSYRQLDQRANQLARLLKIKGLASGDVIGLLFDKSVHSYIAMLAVLKIQAAYVPLDPAFPQDRIAYITADASLKMILTLSQYDALMEASAVEVLCLDREKSAINQRKNDRLDQNEVGYAVSELCYIIYTSGTTGRPKGVPIHQNSICNFVRVAAETYGYQASDRVYQGLTIAFDFAVEEIWVPLIVGATLLPNQTGSSLLGGDLSKFLLDNKITAMCCVPTLLATIEEDLDDLRLLIVSGEACPQDLIVRWSKEGRSILNAYGPTETTVTATLARSKPDEAVTIGKPLPTYSVIILDPDSEKVLPFGVEGEVAVAGVGVAQGYLNRDDQTKKAFIPDFLDIKNNDSGLIYRTGDLGVINENHDIEYRGRIDLQVKIRGYRIELAEIESVIMGMPQIAQAVVDTFEAGAGAKELVAYYSLTEEAEALSQADITEVLREVLPDYMVPSFYEQLDVIPMLASDKADRKALPKPSGERMNLGNSPFVAAKTEVEVTIINTLKGFLDLDKVSINDDFFADLGASSLLMARFCASIRQSLPQADISMRDVYLHPNVSDLARYLESQETGNAANDDSDVADRPFRKPSNWEYYSCGFLQVSSYLISLFISLQLALLIIPWLAATATASELYVKSVALLMGGFIFWTGFSVATKWLLIGKWKKDEIPVWSLKYYRFWLVKQIVSSSPMALFKGYPLYNVYLRMLGAKIGKNVVIESAALPLCTDLVSIGDHTICRKDSMLTTYKAVSNVIYTGSISLGKYTVVSESSVIDMNTVMEDDAQLGHASCLVEGQVIPKGKHYHGNPAEETSSDFGFYDRKKVTALRQIVYSIFQLSSVFFVFAPLAIVLIFSLYPILKPVAAPLTSVWALDLLIMASISFVVMFIVGLFMNLLFAKALNLFLKPERTYTLYGVHHVLFKMVQGLSNSKFYTLLFGDSSFILYYMRWVGYKLHNVIQTGSNFGLEHQHDNPYLCHIGSGTMISDGFSMLNREESSTSFRLSKNSIGENNFVGNGVNYPVNSRTGDNCLLATKVMVPVDGKLRENTGLLGSPCFEIPRSVEGDACVMPTKDSNKANEGLKNKNKYNIRTMLLFVMSGFIYFYSMLLSVSVLIQTVDIGLWQRLGVLLGFSFFSLTYFIFVERAAFNFGRLPVIRTSIYDQRYWQVERMWKFSETFVNKLWLGTPMRSTLNRLLGMKVGKKVFDDGLNASEKTLVEIGDYCNLNHCVLQAHSLEDGLYKSGKIKVGSRCSIENKAFIHYDVVMEDDVRVMSDAFVMKGETLAKGSVWGGNPARKTLGIIS
ncbi:MAG TPA: amino acid adenylation domain-containing protein [Leucothrix mucor]|nr:amino acid adenylation domain-containing protein [Leucothrix mucor]